MRIGVDETGFPPGKRRYNAFMIADVISLKAPHWVTQGAIQAYATLTWSASAAISFWLLVNS
jgi:hypothetical protein